MPQSFSDAQLEAYLDEVLPPECMAQVEEALRADASLADRLVTINMRRDAGMHSIGDIWRRRRLSCATREQLGSLLLGALEPALADYFQFHLDSIGCRFCQANLDDLKAQQAGAEPAETDSRRQKYFQTSAAYLKNQ